MLILDFLPWSTLLLIATAKSVIASPFEASGGAKVAFAGHSYFVPVARQFNKIASAQPDLYPNHSFEYVMRGGENGAPGVLWEDSKYEVETMLIGKDVQLFALTAHSNGGSDLEDYKKWFDLALLYNSATQFFISIPWVTYSPSLTSEELEAQNIAGCEYVRNNITQPLRAEYPDNAVHFMCHSYVTQKLRYRWDNGALPDVTEFVGSDTTGLYTDNFGHGGDYMEHLMGLLWQDWMYGVPSGSSLADFSAAAGDTYDAVILTDVTDAVLSESIAYRLDDIYDTDAVPGPGNPDYEADEGGVLFPSFLRILRRIIVLFLNLIS